MLNFKNQIVEDPNIVKDFENIFNINNMWYSFLISKALKNYRENLMYILGVFMQGPNSSAALFKNARLIAMSDEERFQDKNLLLKLSLQTRLNFV